LLKVKGIGVDGQVSVEKGLEDQAAALIPLGEAGVEFKVLAEQLQGSFKVKIRLAFRTLLALLRLKLGRCLWLQHWQLRLDIPKEA